MMAAVKNKSRETVNSASLLFVYYRKNVYASSASWMNCAR